MENKIKTFKSFSLNENKDIKNYMFFTNLQTIKRLVDDMLTMDESEIDKQLTNGHDWASDHISTSKDDIEEIYNFLRGSKDSK